MSNNPYIGYRFSFTLVNGEYESGEIIVYPGEKPDRIALCEAIANEYLGPVNNETEEDDARDWAVFVKELNEDDFAMLPDGRGIKKVWSDGGELFYRHLDVQADPDSIFYSKIFLDMERIGGSFENILANLFNRADLNNQRKIIETWGDLIEKFRT